MTEPDVNMTRIGKGIELNQHGEREAARAVLPRSGSTSAGRAATHSTFARWLTRWPMSTMTCMMNWFGTYVLWRPRT